MTGKLWTRFTRVAALLSLTLVCLSCVLFGGGRYAMTSISARAESDDYIAIHKYDLEMTVREDRKIEVEEHITVEFLREYNDAYEKLTMFYRSLPVEGARYSEIEAACDGNDQFTYRVEDNPDMDGFLDVCCIGNVGKGRIWTYDISYLMEQNVDNKENGMIIDVVGFGWMVALYDVTVQVHLPVSIQRSDYKVYTDIFGVTNDNEVTHSLSEDGKTITMSADVLQRGWSGKYDEFVTGGITLSFSLPEGTLDDYLSTRIFTPELFWIILGVVMTMALAFLLRNFSKTHREMVTVVNIKAPDEMDPLKMGKWLDGSVDNEDVTSMIYYFADKGYLRIDLSDEEDPELISLVEELPDSEPSYAQTLFDGLFENGRERADHCKAAHISELVGSFYDHMELAKLQVPNPPTMYEKKSVWGYVGGCVLAVLLGFFTCFLMGKRVGGEYSYYWGIVLAVPVLLLGLAGRMDENYRYKWKASQRRGSVLGQIVIAVLSTILFVWLFAGFIMTAAEKIALCVGVFGVCFTMRGVLSRTEEYSKVLGDILGFKDFIIVTEEDKIKFMLEENPDLYYKVLPYAQVLGVTDEWDRKFEKITLQPPEWCSTPTFSVFDHYVIYRCMNRAMTREIAKEMGRRGNSGGGHIGRSGGGGSFGSFGGGGFGGGGGGAR